MTSFTVLLASSIRYGPSEGWHPPQDDIADLKIVDLDIADLDIAIQTSAI